MAASAKHVLMSLLGLLCLELACSNRILKESVDTESVYSEDGSSSAWAGVSVAGSGQASAGGNGYGAAFGSGTGGGVWIGSGWGGGVGVGIGVGGDAGVGAGFGTGTGNIGVGIGVGSDAGVGAGFGTGTGNIGVGTSIGSGSGIGIGIGTGGGSGSGTAAGCDKPHCEPSCVPGECGNQRIIYQEPIPVPSGCQVIGCYPEQVPAGSDTREIGQP